MSLGSPQQSSSGFGGKGSQSSSQGSQGSSSFLPAFLIGSQSQTQTTARSLQAAVSPKSVSFRSENQLAKPRLPVEKSDAKTNAPPVAALNTLFSPQSPSSGTRSFAGSATILHNESRDFEGTRENADIPTSPTQLDPFFQEGGEVSADPTWVTVFGFPTAAEAFILRQFRQYGVILQYVSQPSQANWIHIQYKTKLQARKALSKNGKIIEGQIMIGVTPCVKEPAKTIQSPERVSVLEPINNLPGPNERTRTPIGQKCTPNRTFSGMRRMNSFAAGQSQASNLSLNDSRGFQPTNATNTPQKDNTYLGKTMSYIFGEW